MQKKATIALVGVLLLVALGLLWMSRDKSSDAQSAAMPKPGENTAAMVTDALAKSREAASRFKTGLEGIPKSLQDTEVDGSLEVDADGNLKITRGVRQTFDYFLSAIGEEDLTTIIARIRAHIRNKLPAKAAAQAEKLLEAYISYREGLGHLPQVAGDPTQNLAAIRQQKQAIQGLRSQYFDRNVIEAFFGDEDAYDNYTLARLEVMQDKSLSATEKAKRTAALLEQLPPDLKENVKTLNQYQELTTLTQDWKARGGSPQELRNIREQIVGPEAATRLEALDQERTEWDARMKDYLQERETILKNNALSEQDRQQQVAAMREQRFNQQEQVRVDALERIHDQGLTVPE
jgi:lipase chaperone LimK